MRWKAQNILSDETNNVNLESNSISLMKTALNEMDVRMFETKTLGHPDDVETCKTYIWTIHKYLPEITPIQVQNYLVTELGWKNKDAAEVGGLLQKLKEGKRFIGGQKTHLKEHYDRWKEKL